MQMLREILGLALVVIGLTSMIAHFIAAGRRATGPPSVREGHRPD